MNDFQNSDHKVPKILGYSKLFTVLINWTFILSFFVFISFKIYEFSNSDKLLKLGLFNLKINYLYLFYALNLVFFNYYFEIKKWQFLIQDIQKISFKNASINVLYGLAAGILTPFMIGDFWGRISNYEWKNSSKLISRNIYNSLVQSWTALVFGFGGIYYFNLKVYNWQYLGLNGFLICLVLLIILGFLFFVNNEILFKYLSKMQFFEKFGQEIPNSLNLKTKRQIFIFTLLRNIIYNIQYCLIFKALNINIPLIFMICGVNIILLAKTLGGTLNTFLDLSIRGIIGIEIFRQFNLNTNHLIFATFLIWIINIILPAFVGIYLKIRKI